MGRPKPRQTSLAEPLVAWFLTNAREFPWRDRPLEAERDPYRVLVSETMLQQTQASRVVDRFKRFMDRFPTAHSLAEADVDPVLELWSGLGYYQRARRLHEAARAVVNMGGWPSEARSLRELPGVGRYTAGAVASLAFGERTPAVDGNVARVLLRVRGEPGVLNEPATMKRVWVAAEELLEGTDLAASLVNESLIELGATVCTPASPFCPACPLRSGCVAFATNLQGTIPSPRKAAAKTVLHAASLIVFDDRDRLLVEQRPATGMWGGLWQAPTIETPRSLTAPRAAAAFGLAEAPERIGRFSLATSHRDVRFQVLTSRSPVSRQGAVWKSPRQIGRLGLSSAQRRILVEIAPTLVGQRVSSDA